MLSREEIEERLAGCFDEFDGAEVVYLFGSWARGEAARSSDVDVAVWFDSAMEFSERDELARDLSEQLEGLSVDVVSLADAPPELAYRAIKEGRLVYESDEATRVEVEARILGRYGDYLPVLEQQRRDIAKRGRHDRAVQRYREALGETERLLEQAGAVDRTESD